MDFRECYSDTVSILAAAARSCCSARVRTLIRRGFSVDGRDNRGWNALHEAAAAGSSGCVRHILAAAANAPGGSRSYVNTLTHEGESALYLAAYNGHLAVVRTLLKARADINQPTNDRSCPLYAAVDWGHKKIVNLLVREGADVNGTHTASFWTCLHQAVYKGHSEIVRTLVNVCHLEGLDEHNITPLFVAAQSGQKECLDILIEAGANVNAQAADLATPLLIASQEGHEGCVEVLLEHGADPNLSCSNDWPQLPIHAAAQFGNIRILRRLIAVTDRACDRSEGMVSPLYMAVRRQKRSVRVLLQEGYSPDAQDCTDTLGVCSPLSLALLSLPLRSHTVRLLIAAGATLSEDNWIYALADVKTFLLELILEHRWIPRPDGLGRARSGAGQPKKVLTLQELRALLCVALSQAQFAPCWMPLLLHAGLHPHLLLQPNLLEEANSKVLNYLLGFVNWYVLPRPLREILNRRLQDNTWTPHPRFESVPSLAHVCRLQVREVLGADLLMRSNVIQALPVPLLLQDYLRFTDIQPPAYTGLTPTAVSDRIEGYRSTHTHRHIL